MAAPAGAARSAGSGAKDGPKGGRLEIHVNEQRSSVKGGIQKLGSAGVSANVIFPSNNVFVGLSLIVFRK